MKQLKDIELIDKLTDISKIITTSLREYKQGHRSFGMGPANITFLGAEDVKLLETTIQNLFYANRDISETYIINTFESSIIFLIRELKNTNRKCTTEDLEKIYNDLLSKPIVESEIFYNFYGASTTEASIKYGEFEVYDFVKSHASLKIKYPYLVKEEYYFNHRDSNHVIGIKVTAREMSRAIENADELAKTFENVFNYMIGDLEQRETIGIINYKGWRTTHTMVCNKETSGSAMRSDTVTLVDIEDSYFKEPKVGNNKLWDLITKENKTDIEKRILNAVEWIGKAISEKDPSKSLVMFVFAIEGMLQYNKGAFITASIVSQLSDWLAFIIDEDPKNRKFIAKTFKDIYQKRSAIAHGANKVIKQEDLQYAKEISKLMIISLLTVKPFCDFKHIDKLSEYITDLKFK